MLLGVSALDVAFERRDAGGDPMVRPRAEIRDHAD
jgi:hypothetical protein